MGVVPDQRRGESMLKFYGTPCISTKLGPWNANFPIRDTLDPDSIITEESDPHQKKQQSSKISTNLGILTNIKPVFENTFRPISFIIDSYSKTTDFSPSFGEMHSEVMNSVGGGIHRALPEKEPQSTAETHRNTPSTTINRGQNSFTIFQTIRKVCDLILV
jgi:hypothetical protein